MLLSESDKVLISSLKGRLSKILNLKTKLLKTELNALENIYSVLDRFIIGDGEFNDIEVFKDRLSNHSSFLEKTKKTYIKEHILPLINKVATRNWGTEEDYE